MSDIRPIGEHDLQAYVDGRLDQRRQAEVEAYLAGHPERAAEVMADRANRQALKALFDPVADEPVPAELNLARIVEGHRFAPHPRWQMAAAAVVILLVGGAGGWVVRDAMVPGREAGITLLAHEASDSYGVFAVDASRPVELGAPDETTLLDWVSDKLERPVSVPDLSAAGFTFIGGRVVASPHGPAALYMFDNGKGLRLVMMLRQMHRVDENAPMKRRSIGDVATVSWARDGMGYSLAGPMEPAALHRIADTARDQFDGKV